MVFYLYQDFSKWSIVKLINANAERLYIDSYTVFYYSECYAAIADKVFEINEYCSGWTYGSFALRVISFFKIFDAHEVFGHFFTYATVVSFIYMIIIFKYNKFAQMNLFLGFISPPVWLLLERANFDAIIYIFVFLASLFYQHNYKKTSLFFLLLCTLVKFYTLPLMIIVTAFLRKKSDRVLAFIYSLASILFILNDLTKMQGNIVQAGYNHFGMKIIGNYLGKLDISLSILVQYLIATLLFVSLIGAIFSSVIFKKVKLVEFPHNFVLNFNGNLFNFIVFISCFIVGLSVDYRLIFYIAATGFFLQFIDSKAKVCFSVLFFLSVWLTYPTGILQTLGDFCLEIIAALYTCILLIAIQRNYVVRHKN